MKIRVNLQERSYDCIIEKGILKNLFNYIDSDKKLLIIKDKNVNNKYLPDFKRQNVIVEEFESSEHNKSLKSYQYYTDLLIENNFGRNDIVCAIGGGVTGDLAGFVASTFKRGCNFINCPTTTLSCVDSSIGGKVAINEAGIKNVIGAFYQPQFVLIDTLVLETLPKKHIYNGLIEALKMGLIKDQSLYEMFKNGSYLNNMETVIYKSLDLKRQIVEEDEKEQNQRKLLNFGHTIGHAIESMYLDIIYHGEAVGLGMLYMIEDLKVKEDVKTILGKMGVDTNIDVDVLKAIELIKNDKKAQSDYIDIVKVKTVGNAYIKRVYIDEIKQLIENGN